MKTIHEKVISVWNLSELKLAKEIKNIKPRFDTSKGRDENENGTCCNHQMVSYL